MPVMEEDPDYYDRLGELIRGMAEGGLTGALGGPVDLANMGLGALGLGSEKPIMGSEDIRERLTDAGIYQPRTGSGEETVDDDPWPGSGAVGSTGHGGHQGGQDGPRQQLVFGA
jgi:hypothetical protein